MVLNYKNSVWRRMTRVICHYGEANSKCMLD